MSLLLWVLLVGASGMEGPLRAGDERMSPLLVLVPFVLVLLLLLLLGLALSSTGCSYQARPATLAPLLLLLLLLVLLLLLFAVLAPAFCCIFPPAASVPVPWGDLLLRCLVWYLLRTAVALALGLATGVVVSLLLEGASVVVSEPCQLLLLLLLLVLLL
jgi:hypothetical protein